MSQQLRPPIVTILGHVDHGKTTLLDFIRKTAVASKEHGGITQAIGAYQVEIPRQGFDGELSRTARDDLTENRKITFIDTPGHAAFEKMRSRGASVADIAVLVVAVDDGVMPQTIEAIKHIQAAKVPMIAAVNKIDKPGINIKVQLEKIKKQLSDQGVLVEEYGGDVPIVSISAASGEGVDNLLETIVLVAEIHEFKGDPDKQASGVVIESRLDKFKGPVASILIRDGSLQKGDQIIVGESSGKVRGMFDFAGKALEKAVPSQPVEVLGLTTVPLVGSHLGEGKVAGKQATQIRSLLDRLAENKEKVLNVVIKADKAGSLEAIETVLQEFNKQEKHLEILSSGTGGIVDSDIELVSPSRGIVLGFNVPIAPTALRLAERAHVLIRTYNIIYEMIDEVTDVVETMLIPGKIEDVFGSAQIIAEFPFGKGERIAGCKILEGTVSKGPKVRIVRGGEVIGEAKIKSLKKVREEVSKVEKGTECGMLFDSPVDFKIGDIVESFKTY